MSEPTESANSYDCFKYLASRVTDELVISGIGFHEWLALTPGREANCPLGALGATVPLALGIASSLPHRKVVCLTTDGDILFEVGVLLPVGNYRPKNLVIIVNDNEVYQSTGKGKNGYWPTMTRSKVDLVELAKASGINNSLAVRTVKDFESLVDKALVENSLRFIVLKSLAAPLRAFRPDTDNVEYKYRFLRYIERMEGISILPKQSQDRSLLMPGRQKS